jgi:hypothetical protein
MKPFRTSLSAALLVPALLWGTAALAQPQQPSAQQPQQGQPKHSVPVLLPDKPDLDPKALEILKAASARLAAARTMSFTSVATYESPARTLQPLAYTTLSEVTLQRPNRLQVITKGDGPPTEFYYDGKQIIAYAPQEDLAAVADAPPTIDAMLKFAYETAAFTFPFDDIIASDPYKELDPDLKLAFVVGQSRVVGGTRTDIVALVSDVAQAQIWIGIDDKLPRMVRVTYFNEPGNFRHVVEFSDWHLDTAPPAGAFTSARAVQARRVKFASPDLPPQAPK